MAEGIVPFVSFVVRFVHVSHTAFACPEIIRVHLGPWTSVVQVLLCWSETECNYKSNMQEESGRNGEGSGNR